MKRHLWLLACLSALLAAACGSEPSKDEPEVHHPKLPAGSTIAVVSFRDCTIADQDDCAGSGGKSADAFMTQFATATVFHAVKLPRPVDTKAELGDDAAVAYAKQKGYAYVMNGEVTDFYQVAPMTFRKERAAIAVRVLSVADGKILHVHADDDTGNHDSPPVVLMKDMAKHVLDDLEDN